MKKVSPYLRSFSPFTIRVAFLLGASLFFLGLFIKLTSEIKEEDIIHFYDRQVLEWIGSLRTSFFNGPMIDVTALGSPTILTIFAIFGVLLLLSLKNYFAALYITVASIGAGIGTLLLKSILGRERPDVIPKLVEVSGLSYPSGHSFGAAAFYFSAAIILISYIKNFKVRIGLFIFSSLFITMIGTSRIYLGVHYPSDVLSGIFLGISWSLWLAGIMVFYRARSNYKQ